MAGSLIGALRVSLGLDSAQFETGVKKAQNSAKSGTANITGAFGSIIGTAKLVTAAVAAIGSAAVVMAVRQSVDAMDDLSKAAQKVGTSVPELAKLQWAAELSDVATESLQKGLNKLNIAITGIAPGAKGAAGELMRMGVTAGTGTLDAMMKVADQFARMPDSATKSAMAIKLFGKAGADMIPLLNGGSEGLKAAAEEAERLGLVIDTKTARAAEEFNDNLTRLGVVSDGITTQISAGLVPALAVMTGALVDGLNAGNGLGAVGKALGNVLLFVAEVSVKTGAAIGGIVSRMGALSTAAQLIYTKGDFSGAGKVLSDNNAAIAKEYAGTTALFDKIRSDIANFQPGEIKPKAMPGDIQFGDPATAKKAKKPAEEFVNPVDREGWALQQLLDRGTAASVDVNNQALQGVAATLADLKGQDFSLDIIQPAAFQKAEQFAASLSQSLGQALVFGQSLGDALVNSFKAAAAEMIASGLFKILGKLAVSAFGGIGGIGAALGIPGFADGTNYAPGGLAMVGERGRELVNLPRGSQVIPNGPTEAMMRGGQPQVQQVQVTVAPSPLFLTSVVQGSRAAAADTMRRAGRQSLPASRAA